MINYGNKVWGELKDLVISIKDDITKTKGMWLAYAFLLSAMFLIVSVCVMLLVASVSIMAAYNEVAPDFFFDNPIPLFIYGAIIYAAYALLHEVHTVYLTLRQIIKKGNR